MCRVDRLSDFFLSEKGFNFETSRKYVNFGIRGYWLSQQMVFESEVFWTYKTVICDLSHNISYIHTVDIQYELYFLFNNKHY